MGLLTTDWPTSNNAWAYLALLAIVVMYLWHRGKI
jgi:hypothetical protein